MHRAEAGCQMRRLIHWPLASLFLYSGCVKLFGLRQFAQAVGEFGIVWDSLVMPDGSCRVCHRARARVYFVATNVMVDVSDRDTARRIPRRSFVWALDRIRYRMWLFRLRVQTESPAANRSRSHVVALVWMRPPVLKKCKRKK